MPLQVTTLHAHSAVEFILAMFLHAVPKPPLSTHVRLLWYYEGYAPASPRERLLPTGTLEIVFELSGQPSRVFRDENDATGATFPHSVVCGPQSRYFILDTGGTSDGRRSSLRARRSGPLLRRTGFGDA